MTNLLRQNTQNNIDLFDNIAQATCNAPLVFILVVARAPPPAIARPATSNIANAKKQSKQLKTSSFYNCKNAPQLPMIIATCLRCVAPLQRGAGQSTTSKKQTFSKTPKNARRLALPTLHVACRLSLRDVPVGMAICTSHATSVHEQMNFATLMGE